MTTPTNLLAVIIPCARIDYLDAALLSLSNQTNKNFNIYLGDDAVTTDLSSVVQKYQSSLNISYTRFQENLGRKDLVAQWDRCIRLSKNEPWIWVFSDDDIADPGCVKAFYLTIRQVGEKFDVYRFNSLVIDPADKVIRICQPNPLVEKSIVFAYHRLKSERYSFLPNYIFSREIYYQKNGFVKFPFGWGSDDATWIEFSGDKGIYTIEGSFVRWRMSNNISSVNISGRQKKMLANIQFLKWLKIKFHNKRCNELNLDDKLLLRLSRDWLVAQWVNESAGKFIWDFRYWASLLNEIYNDGINSNIRWMIRINKKILLRRFSIFR